MSTVTRNIVYNGVGQGLSVLLGFVAVRYVFRSLGGDALGMIYFALAFAGALTVCVQLGICESAVREVASHYGSRPEYIERFIRTSAMFYWVGYVLLSVVAYVAAPYLVYHWVKLGSLDALTAIKITRILSLGALLALPSGLYRALLVGLQHMGYTNLIDVGARALQQAGIFVILLVHGNLFHVAYWIVASLSFQVIAYGMVCLHYFSASALLVPGFSVRVVRENMGYASGLMVITVCSWVLGQADKVIISKLLPLTLLGFYTVARGAVAQGQLLPAAISNAIFPHFSALFGAGRIEELKAAYNRIHFLICFGTLPIFAAAPFAAIPLFSRLFDAEAGRMLLLPATFLSVSIYMNGTLTTPYVVSLAMGRPDITARQKVAALFVVLPASACAIYWFGLNGAGFSGVIYHVFAYSYGLPRICHECLGERVQEWYRRVLGILGMGLLVYGGAWTAVAMFGNFSIPCLAAAYLLATLAYSAASLWMMGGELLESILALRRPLGVDVELSTGVILNGP